MLRFINFPPPADFVDRHGKVRPISTCSLTGRVEFFERVDRIQSILQGAETGETWEWLYFHNTELRHHVDRSLELNGIKPKWVTPEIAERLLFHRYDIEQEALVPGWLITLNTPKQTDTKPAKSLLSNPESIGALLAVAQSYTQNLEDAIALISEIPAEIAADYMQASNELAEKANPDKRKARKPKGKAPTTEELLAEMAKAQT
jgi:hypothetical protein